jgi:hypothetical protein
LHLGSRRGHDIKDDLVDVEQFAAGRRLPGEGPVRFPSSTMLSSAWPVSSRLGGAASSQRVAASATTPAIVWLIS